MPISLPSTYAPVSLNSTYATPEENAAAAMAAEQEALAQNTSFGRGLSRGLYRTPAMLGNALGQVIEPFSTQHSQPVFDWASEQNQAAQRLYAPNEIRSFDQVHGIGDAASYVGGAIGENLPNMLATLPLGIAARVGLRGAALSPLAKNVAATSAAAFPLQVGEMAGSLREDPTIMDSTTPLQRLGTSALYGAATAPLEAADEALLMGRVMGAGGAVKNIFKDGIKASVKDAAKHVAMAVPEAALTEGLPEAAQTGIQQTMLSGLNPERDTSRDSHDATDAFFKGWAAGGGTSVAGRGADVAWAQGRGATEALRGLLDKKLLPDSLKNSDDQTVLDWSRQDDEQRNGWAKGLADSILNSDAAQSLKDSATDFYDKLSGGAKDAWRGMSDALGVEDKLQRGRDALDDFIGAAKKANKAAFGKANAESDPFDQDLYDNFSQHLDPKGAAARDTELKSRLYNTVKDSLLDDDWHNLPWHALEDEFGTIGRATDAVVKLRENLVRAGKLEHDDEFGSLFQATIKDGQAGERAMMDVVSRYGTEYIKRKPSDSELRDTVRGIRKMLMNPEFMRKNKDAVDAQMAKAFGSAANAQKVIAALSPKNNVEAGIETEVENVDDTTGQTFKGKSAEEFAPGTRFVGSGVKGLRKQVASDEPGQNLVANHGGFWKLGHEDAKKREAIQTRFKDTAADLRKSGHYVRELSPLEYAAEAGVSPSKIALHLGVTVEQLKDHPARMLAIDERDMEKDKLSLDHDDLLNLSDKAKQSFAGLDKGLPVGDEEQRSKIAGALAKSGYEQRKAMKELGLEHGVKLRLGKNGAYLENNPRHGGNGVFTVHMQDGTQHHVSAQQLIATMRERGRGQFSSRSAYDMFNSGIAALMNIDGVQNISVQDVWGRTQESPFELKKSQSGKWRNYFQLEPGLNLGDAQRASRRGQFKDKTMTALEQAYAEAEATGNEDAVEQAQQDIDDELARREALQDTLEGEGEREGVVGVKSATDDDSVTPGDHARETPLDFNDDGTPKHPYGKPTEHSTDNVTHSFDGVTLYLRPGVSAKHVTGDARRVVGVARALLKIKDSPTFTSSRMEMALDLVARSAAAQKDGDTAARDAATYAAADAVRQAVLDEIEVAQAEGNTDAVDKLTTLAARVLDLSSQHDAKAHTPLLAQYPAYRPRKDTTARGGPGKVATALKAEQTKLDDQRGQAETNDAVAAESKARAAADAAWMELSEEERTERVAEAAQPVEQALTSLAKLSRSYAQLVKAVRQALRTLKEAWVNGELDKAELVQNLREAVAALRAVAGDAVTVLREATQKFIKGYRETKVEFQRMAEAATSAVKENSSLLFGLHSTQSSIDNGAELISRVREKMVSAKDQGLNNDADAIDDLKKDGFFKFNKLPDANEKLVLDAIVETIREMYPTVVIKTGLVGVSGPYDAAVIPSLDTLIINKKFINGIMNSSIGKEALGAFATTLHHEVAHLMDNVASKKLAGYKKAGDTMYASHFNPRLKAKFVEGLGYIGEGDLAKEADRLARSFFNDHAFMYPVLANTRLVKEAAFSSEIVAQSLAYYRTDPEGLKKLSPKLYQFGKEVADAIESGDSSKIFAVIAGVSEGVQSSDTLPDSTVPSDAKQSRDGFVFKAGAEKLVGKETAGRGATGKATPREWVNAITGFDEFVDRMSDIAGDVKTQLKAILPALRKNDTDTLKQIAKDFAKSSMDAIKAIGRVLERMIHARLYIHNVAVYGNAVEWAGLFYMLLGSSTGVDHSEQVKHNAEGSFASGQGVTQAEFDAVKDYVAKTLGPKVKAQLVKELGGNSAAWNRVNGEAIIRIAANAANPLSKAHHEAMHEFFQRLMDAHPEAAEVLRTAANNPMVKRQIEQFFHNDANYAKIKDAIAKDEHERVAYMFQLWAAGKLNVGPKTQSWFQKVASFFRKAFGLLSNDQKAEAIMQAFHDGKMSEPNAVAEVLAKDTKTTQDFLDRAAEWIGPVAERTKELFYTAQNILSESENKGFQAIGRQFSTTTGDEAQEMSFMDAKTMKANQMNDRLFNILKGRDEKDIAAALDGLQRGETSKDADIAKMQERIRHFLDQAHTYATKAGVDLKKVQDYFPRVWDALAIAENKDKFVTMLQAEHFKTTGKPLNEAVAQGIASSLIQGRGHEPVNETELSNGYSPFMASANKRVLDFIKSPEFAEFQEKSLETILATYISQLVHKAEYTRRFGPNGAKLRDSVVDAVGEEIGPEWAKAKAAAEQRLKEIKARHKNDPAGELSALLASLGYRYGGIAAQHVANELVSKEAKDKYAAFEPTLRRNLRAIMAMEGTLGADINPNLRKWSAGLMVYENLRLLGMSLFSQVIDPLGVMVRGGTVSQAWDTFTRGVAGVWNGWRGTVAEDSATKLAMQLGIVDAGGYLNSQANAYTSLYMGKTAQKWNDRLFRFNGVEGFSQGTRVGAMNAAIAFIKHHSALPSEHSARWLAELNLKKEDIKLADGELDYSDQKIQQAIFRWVEGAILRPNASMRPSWASDPHFALLFHLKQFTYAMQKVLLERVANEAKHGNLDPAIGMVLTYVPTMIAADFLRGLAANGGQEPPWKRKWNAGDYLVEGVQRAGLLGVPQIALDTVKWGPGELAGPLGEQLSKTGKTFYKDIKKDAYLDEVAGVTGALKDIERATKFNGVEHAVKKTLRDAMPINSLTKRYVYDELVGQ